jgi:hypothetical protein
VPPTLLCDLFLRVQLPLSPAHTTFIVDDDARVSAVKFSGLPVNVDTADPFDRFSHLIFDHFEPLITDRIVERQKRRHAPRAVEQRGEHVRSWKPAPGERTVSTPLAA